jgi:RNase P subunit RPR2
MKRMLRLKTGGDNMKRYNAVCKECGYIWLYSEVLATLELLEKEELRLHEHLTFFVCEDCE